MFIKLQLDKKFQVVMPLVFTRSAARVFCARTKPRTQRYFHSRTPLLDSSKSNLWFKDGVCFQCTGCGSCCIGEGYVYMTAKDTQTLASHLSVSTQEFDKRYTEQSEGGSKVLKNRENSDYCIFLDDNKKCTVYENRPLQCRTYPFWPHVMQSERRWKNESKSCEGIKSSNSIAGLQHSDTMKATHSCQQILDIMDKEE